MMRKSLLVALLVLPATIADAQSSTTNCYAFGASVQCQTNATPGVNWGAVQQQQQQLQQQNQQNTNQAFANLGAAIAARRERKREERRRRLRRSRKGQKRRLSKLL